MSSNSVVYKQTIKPQSSQQRKSMATTIDKLAINGLLVDISDTLPVAKFTELINLYNDVPVPDGITDHFRVLKYLKDNGKLELEELAKNLEDIVCEDQSQKVREVIDFKATKRQRANSAAFIGPRGVAGEIQPEEASPGVRKKGTNDQDDPHTDGEVVEEIPCDEPNDNDKKYMQEAIDLQENSGDEKTKVGSVLVHPQNGIIGRGYNRMPLCRGHELEFSWASQDGDRSSLDTKYLYVVHSAIAAIIDATGAWTKDGISGSTLYTTLFPAYRDAQMFVEYGITTVVFIDDCYKLKSFTKASKIIMEQAEIKIRRLDRSKFTRLPTYKL